MLSVADALQKLLNAVAVVGTEAVPLSNCAGRVLAVDVHATFDSPRFANSSMDGFAVRAADLQGASKPRPKSLLVAGDIPAGKSTSVTLQPGHAMRIMTGAALPPGADAVAPVEDTDVPGGQAALPAVVNVGKEIKAGDYVRPAGQDFHEGDRLIQAGARMRAQDLALLAMLGIAEVTVYRRPRVAVFSSGDELLPMGERLGAGKIYETNSYALQVLIESAGAECISLGIAADNLDEVKSFLDKAASENVDLILSSAGVSVGAFDYLRDAVASDGQLDFWKVNMRPGRPFTFGKYKKIAYIGLPGNPASAFVGFEVFVRPVLESMGGNNDWQRKHYTARLMEVVESDGRESFLRVKLEQKKDEIEVYLTGHQGSGNLYSLVQAEALMRVPAGVKKIRAKSKVEIWPL
jgi:molybdopterin molybdotransferase